MGAGLRPGAKATEPPPDPNTGAPVLDSTRRCGDAGRTRVRLLAVESARSVPRAADPGRLDIEVIRAGETMMRAVAVFVGRAVRGVAPVTTGRRPGSGR